MQKSMKKKKDKTQNYKSSLYLLKQVQQGKPPSLIPWKATDNLWGIFVILLIALTESLTFIYLFFNLPV